MLYSYAQLEGIWVQNGGNTAQAPIAAAVAMAESGGNPDATNTNTDGSIDRGLWQINSTHGAQSTFDVNGNAKSAVAISSNGANWNPWVTFKSGAYKRFLKGGVAPSQPGNQPQQTGANLLSAPSGIAGGIMNLLGLGQASQFLTDVAAFVHAAMWLFKPSNWLRIGAFFAGGILILIALWAFVKVGSDEPMIKMPQTIPVPV